MHLFVGGYCLLINKYIAGTIVPTLKFCLLKLYSESCLQHNSKGLKSPSHCTQVLFQQVFEV